VTALPADVAKYTNDGVVVTSTNPAIKAEHVDARNSGAGEIEMFFDSEADAQILLDEKFTYLSKISPVHDGIEVEESLGLGTTVAIAPQVPSFRVVDESRQLDQVARVRAYAFDLATDRFSVEVIA
jgi:hypothetical protein